MTVSTHVLDASAGRPAAGVAVTLSLSRPDGGWLDLESGTTDADGRHRFAAPTPPGRYRLAFGTGQYFAARAVATFYPEVTIAFAIPEPEPGGAAPVAGADGGGGGAGPRTGRRRVFRGLRGRGRRAGPRSGGALPRAPAAVPVRLLDLPGQLARHYI
jgi:5-hydroxyisourate hydrolase